MYFYNYPYPTPTPTPGPDSLNQQSYKVSFRVNAGVLIASIAIEGPPSDDDDHDDGDVADDIWLVMRTGEDNADDKDEQEEEGRTKTRTTMMLTCRIFR